MKGRGPRETAASRDGKIQKITNVNFSKTPVVVKSPSSCYIQILGASLFRRRESHSDCIMWVATGGKEAARRAASTATALREAERRERQQQKRKWSGAYRLSLYL
jgi:hypothetical protein